MNTSLGGSFIRTFWPRLLAAVVVIPTGCFNLDALFDNGADLRTDDAQAAARYAQACAGGDADGCYKLGLMYHRGEGVQQDLTAAVELYEKACAGGNTDGCYDYENQDNARMSMARAGSKLGTLLLAAGGKDAALSPAAYEQACMGGFVHGCSQLGLTYELGERLGEGIQQDLARAAEMYERGCSGGDGYGCYRLGLMYYRGEGVQQDRARAVDLHEQACTAGNIDGCDFEAALFDNGVE